MDKPTFNPDTVGVGSPTEQTTNRPQGTTTEKSYGQAIEYMCAGGMIQREGWNGKGMYVFKQVPSKVSACYVPKMSSLPDAVKARMVADGIDPHYQNQMVIVKSDGSIDNWVASSSDTFATDWVLL